MKLENHDAMWHVITFMGSGQQFLEKYKYLTSIGYWKDSSKIVEYMLDNYSGPITFNDSHSVLSIYGGRNSLIRIHDGLFIVVSGRFGFPMKQILQGDTIPEQLMRHLKKCEINRTHTIEYIPQANCSTIKCPICEYSNTFNSRNRDSQDDCYNCGTTYYMNGSYYRYDELLASMINSGEYCFTTNDDSDELYLTTIKNYNEYDLILQWMQRNRDNFTIEYLIDIVNSHLHDLIVEYLDNQDS